MAHFVFCFLTSFLIAFASMPSVIRIATRLSIFDEPNQRKLHSTRTPLLGGISVFAASLFTFSIWAVPYFEPRYLFIIAAWLLLFFFGLRDDIDPLAPWKKLTGQILAVCIVIFFCDIRLPNLFGGNDLPLTSSVLWTSFVLLFIINAYNFIDGIDGLAAGLGIISSFVMGLLFIAFGDWVMATLALSLCGAQAGFLPFNCYKAKIFMGDTGTMTIGLMLGIFSVHLVGLSRQTMDGFFSDSYAPVVVFSVLIVPISDMFRVFALRIFKRQSPFSPDKSHIHHRLLEMGLSQPAVCTLLTVVTISFIAAAWILRNQNPFYVILLFALASLSITRVCFFVLSYRRSKIA